MVKWYHSCLPSKRPGFDSRSLHLCLFFGAPLSSGYAFGICKQRKRTSTKVEQTRLGRALKRLVKPFVDVVVIWCERCWWHGGRSAAPALRAVCEPDSWATLAKSCHSCGTVNVVIKWNIDLCLHQLCFRNGQQVILPYLIERNTCRDRE